MGCTVSRECQKCQCSTATRHNSLGLDLCCNCAHDYHRFQSQRQFYSKAKEKLYPRTNNSAAISLRRISSGRNWEGPSIHSPYQPSKHVEELYHEDSQSHVVYQWLSAQKLKSEGRYYSIINTSSSSSSSLGAAGPSASKDSNTGGGLVTVQENTLEVSVSDNDNGDGNNDDDISTSSKSSSRRHYCRAVVDQEQHGYHTSGVFRQVAAS
jgi:hypothetical protein